MKIKSINIENFGNFSKANFEFEDGVNNFIEENGWGKSTLSAFIKAMFYGLDERGRKKDIFVERERYLPWNGGKFGGSLVFSLDNKDYKIIRFFHEKKQAEDSCKVIDMQTNKETEKFGDDIGLSVFGINKESFERSCFINMDASKVPELNDDISGKLNNILEAGDDIGNCQIAIDNISNVITKLDGRGKKTATSLLQDEISKIKEELLGIESKEKSVPETQRLLDSAKLARSKADEKIKKLESEKANIQLFEQKVFYEDLQNKLSKEIENRDNIVSFFDSNIPSEETVENLKKENTKYVQSKLGIENNKTTDEEKEIFSSIKVFFGSDVPSDEEIENCQNLLNKKRSIEADIGKKELSAAEIQEFEILNNQFSGQNITVEDLKDKIAAVDKVQASKDELSKQEVLKQSKEEEVNKLKQEQKNKEKTNKIVGVVVSSLLIVAGIILFVIKVPVFVSFALFGGAVIALVLCFVRKVKIDDNGLTEELNQITAKINSLNDEINAGKKYYETFINNIHKSAVIENPYVELMKIDNELKRYKVLLSKRNEFDDSKNNNENLSEITRKLNNFIAIYEEKCNTTDSDKILSILRNKKKDYNVLVNKIPKFDESTEAYKIADKNLNSWLSSYKVDKTRTYEDQIDEIKNKLASYNSTEEKINDYNSQIADFKEKHDMDLVLAAKETEKKSEDLQKEIDAEQDSLQKCISDINSYSEILDQLYSDIDQKDSLENKKSLKEDELKQIKDKVSIFEKTKDFMEEARESLSTKYMGKMENAFSSYLNSIDEIKDISIDNSLNVKVEGGGDCYDSSYLSNGYKDIVNFCTRLALVDAMFEDEKPLLVLDDPFVNLDKDKIENALEIVKNLGIDKQVIYFTCHESRKCSK